jgi:glyoxylase-like metal-dependent hydrolase (beta-lactamase superfamily II)
VKLGTIEIMPVIDGVLASKLPSTKPLPDANTYAWQEQHGIFRPDGLMENTIGAFLVRTGDRVILIDAGAGQEPAGGYCPPVINLDDDDDPLLGFFRGRGIPEEIFRRLAVDLERTELSHGRLPESLEALGVDPAEVTDLVFTHLHFDHIGWVTADGAAFFPNATLHCAAADLDHFLPGSHDWFSCQVFKCPRTSDRLAPVLDRFETWETDCNILPGIDVRLTPGHTPGSSVVVISSGAERAMLLGDMIHCPLELMDDEFNLLGDHDQKLANRVREAYARELEGSGVAVAAAHFPDLRFGRLLPGTGVRHWSFDAH